MTASIEPTRPRDRADLETWVRRGCALIVAAVAAYSSFEHQRGFALRGGADPTNAMLWPLSVDGLLLLATVELLKPGHRARRIADRGVGGVPRVHRGLARRKRRRRPQVGVAAGAGGRLAPVALLLAVELLAHRSGSRRTESEVATPKSSQPPRGLSAMARPPVRPGG